MKHSTRTLVLAFVAAVMVGMPCLAQDDSQGVWKRLPDMAVPRWEAGSVVFESKLYVFGGYRMPTKACKRVDVFDPKDNSWTKLADLPSAITHVNMVLDGRSVWFAGGFKDGYKGYAISEVWRYDIDKNTYTAGPSLPQPRASGGLAIVGRKLHFTGGLTADRDTCSPKHWVLDTEELEKSEAQWEEAKPMSNGRCHFGTVTFDGKIYLTGGMYHHDSKQIDRPLVDIYDPETDSWSRGADLPTGHTHAEASTFVQDKRIWFLGGMAQVADKRWIDNKITVLTSEGTWKQVGELPQPLSAAAAGMIDGKLYLAGGSLNGAHPQPGMWVRIAPSLTKRLHMEKKNNRTNCQSRMTRRDFIGAAASVASFTIVPRYVLGGLGQTPPSEKLNIACIGVGGKGFDDVRNVSTENIVAICDVDTKRAAEAFKMFSEARKYSDYRRMLDKEAKNIDAVVIATPDHVHIPASVRAMRMGKHVYCEKPLGQNITEIRLAAKVAKETGVVTQMGNSAHTGYNYRSIAQMVKNGVIGDVTEVHCWCDQAWPPGDRPKYDPPVPKYLNWDLWLGPAPVRPYHPTYHPQGWRNWWDFGNGRIGDMGCHMIDLPFMALDLKYPFTVEAQSAEPAHAESAPGWLISK